MQRYIHNHAAVLVLAGAAALAAPTAHADVTLTEYVSVEGTGMMSLASMAGTTITSISGKNARIENDLRMESRFARMIARDAGNGTEVVRLAEDVVLEIETRKKRYRQSSVSARRAQLEQAAQQLKQAQAQQPMSAGLDDSQCDWSEPTAQVKKLGVRESIAGVSSQQTTVVVKQTCKLRSSGAVCVVAIASDLWLAPEFPGAEEAQQFRNAYSQQLGLTTGSGAFAQQAQSLFGRYPASWTRLADELRRMKGYPVKTTFALEMDGAGCKASQSQTGKDAQNPAAVASQLIGGLFGRKQPDAREPAASAPVSTSGSATAQIVLRVSSTLTAIDSAMIGAETFQPPSGFRKIDK